eukprot:scaffold11190_cov156-Skeletonema_menzelii.AAC.1
MALAHQQSCFAVIVVAAAALYIPVSVSAFSFSKIGEHALIHNSCAHPLRATIERDGLFWPSSSPNYGRIERSSTISDEDDDELFDEEEFVLASTLDAVVKIYATHSDPDFLIPWQKRQQTTSTSSGFVIDVPGIGLRVMTNAHSVEYGSVVQVQRRGDDEKHAAIVEAVGNECDLALLRVDSLFSPQNDDQFQPFAMPIGPLPALQDDVEVIGYPAGGDSLCVTKGVVSRIEMQEYAQAGASLLAMQIDAAINPGNSGGPVVNDALEVVGVAFQGIDEESIENVGYVVPASVVRHFLEDVRRNNGKYTGFCHLGIDVSFLENKTYRKFLKMDNLEGEKKRISGVCVRRIQPTAGAFGILQPMDVVMAVDGIPVGNDGKIPFRRGERVNLGCYISSLFPGDVATVSIFRDGKEMEVAIPVSPVKHLVPSHYNNRPPPYLICSGFVFTALSVPYLDAKGAWDDFYTEDVSYLLGLVHTPLKQEGDEVVVLTQVLAHEANLGYEHLIDLHLLKFNGVEVKSLGHLNTLISENEEQFMTFEFAPEEGGRLIVMERALCEQATEDVCKEHSIGSHYVLRTDTV